MIRGHGTPYTLAIIFSDIRAMTRAAYLSRSLTNSAQWLTCREQLFTECHSTLTFKELINNFSELNLRKYNGASVYKNIK